MRTNWPWLMGLLGGLLLAGCAAPQRRAEPPSPALASSPVAQSKPRSGPGATGLSAELEARILALDPEQVSEQDVRELLEPAPAPRVINIHGGLLPLRGRMTSFAHFLMGMGYPENSVRDPGTGVFTYGSYDDSDRIAGVIAWHYEREGLRPMIVGHSLGGFQAIRVLHKLAGNYEPRLSVWNPLTQREEKRYDITDPLTGKTRPVVGLRICFATAAVSGGLARALPTEWDMNTKLREIPDSVEEFTGFQKGLDPLGGDYFGYGPSNDYHPTGTAIVRNVRLPASGAHLTIPSVKDLLDRPEVRNWINRYRPIDAAEAVVDGKDAQDAQDTKDSKDPGNAENAPEVPSEFGLSGTRVLWAAEVWHGIKKHWVIELQRLIRATPVTAADPRP